jgi:GNAT superfamily N-acetyltransferase
MAVEIFTAWRPGLIGEIARAHSLYYAIHWNFGAFFEAKVATDLSAFVRRFQPDRDRLFSAWSGETFLGSLVMDGSDPDNPAGQAHLRWFVMTDAARGQGIGARLMAEAMKFLAESGFSSCYLTTFRGLDTARRLYERHGFVLVAEAEDSTWGATVSEQRFELHLKRS